MTTPVQPALPLAALPAEVWMYGALALAAGVAFAVWKACYRWCPPNRLLVIFGMVGKGRSYKVLHGGGAFVVPLVQDYSYLSLDPIVVSVENLNLRTTDAELDIEKAEFTVAISIDPRLMETAAERLLNVPTKTIREWASGVVLERLTNGAVAVTADQIRYDPEPLMKAVQENMDRVLSELGMHVINLRVQWAARRPT